LNLSPLNDNTHILWTDPGQTKLALTVCGHINDTCGVSGECTQPNCCTFCQYWKADPDFDGACLGKIYSGSQPSGGGVLLTYTGGDRVTTPTVGDRVAHIDVQCGSDAFHWGEFDSPTKPAADGKYYYNITITTNVICGGASGLFGGGIFLILVLGVALPVYVIGGVAWNKLKENKEGAELFPHVEFWAASPGYFMKGCSFTMNKLTGGRFGGGYETVS